MAEYWNEIQSGGVNVGKWIRQLYEVILKGIEDGRWQYDDRLAENAIRFIERFCHHYKGKLAPRRIRLDLWEKAAISLIFGIVDAEGKRQFTEVFWVIGRKQGKTLLAAAIATYMAYAAGEFGSELYMLAPKIDQSDLVYSAVEFNVNAEPELQSITRSTKYRGLMIQETNTTIKKLAFSSKKSDGYNPMFFVADEVAAWPGVNGLRQWEVMVSGTGARSEPLGMAISSGGYENEGLFDELMKRSTGFLMGNSREQHILPIIYMIDDPEKWDDLKELEKSLPGLGVSVSEEFIRKEIDVAHESASKLTEFKVKYTNLKQNLSTAWLRAEDINKAFGFHKPLEELKNHYTVGGVDLSQSVDLTSACILTEVDGILWVHSHFWLPNKRLEEATRRDNIPYEIYIKKGFLSLSGEEFINHDDVVQWFMNLVKEYKIYPLQIGYDRWSSQEVVQKLTQKSFHMDSVTQGFNLSNVSDIFEGMLREGRIRDMDDNDLLKIHLADAAQQMESNAEQAHPRKKLVKISKNAHVDGCAALLDALAMRQFKWAELGTRLMNVK
ncbi:MAG: terminase large subunit [Clostridia bacterium]|nr:terminase large subunit [Clostridia bacterium]